MSSLLFNVGPVINVKEVFRSFVGYFCLQENKNPAHNLLITSLGDVNLIILRIYRAIVTTTIPTVN